MQNWGFLLPATIASGKLPGMTTLIVTFKSHLWALSSSDEKRHGVIVAPLRTDYTTLAKAVVAG
jgi:hypothetical protein